MAKRRVGNPLFATQEPDQFINLQEPSFLEGFNDEIPEVEGVGGESPQLPPEMDQEMPQSLEVQDARQLPLPEKEESSWLDSIGQYFTKGLQTIGGERYPEQDDELAPQDYAGLENLSEAPESVEAPEPMETATPISSPATAQPEYEADVMQGLGTLAEGEAEEQQAAQEVNDPQFVENVIAANPPKKPQLEEQEVMQKAEMEGKPVPGAVETGRKNPYVMNELARISGVGELPEDLVDYSEDWQNALTKRKEELNAREKALLERMETGELSNFDKLGIALAVAIPVVMGLMYGGSAFALAAGGVLQTVGGLKNQEAKAQTKAKEELESITKDKLKLAEEGVKLKQQIIDKTPNKDARRFIRSKEMQEFGNDIGLSAGDENRTLWINSSKIHDDEDVKKMRERTKEAEELIGGVANFNKALDGVQDVISAIQDQDPGLMDILKKNFKVLETTAPDQIANSSLGDILSLISKIPGTGGKPVMIEILGKDGKVTKVNGLDALQQSIKALQNDYNTAVLKGSRLTENVMKHWSGIMFDPTSIAQFLSSGIEGWSENSNNLRNIMNRKIQEELVGYGFIRQPIQEAFPVNERTVLRPLSAVNRDINQNPDAYKSKVR